MTVTGRDGEIVSSPKFSIGLWYVLCLHIIKDNRFLCVCSFCPSYFLEFETSACLVILLTSRHLHKKTILLLPVALFKYFTLLKYLNHVISVMSQQLCEIK